jgi:hypothetical protein
VGNENDSQNWTLTFISVSFFIDDLLGFCGYAFDANLYLLNKKIGKFFKQENFRQFSPTQVWFK